MAVIIIKERNPAIKQMLRMQPNDGGPLPPPGMDITQSTGFVASNWKALGFWAMASGFLLFGALFVFIGTQASAKGQKGAEFMMPMGLLFIVTAMITAYRAWKLRTTQGQPLLLLSSDGLIDYRKAGHLVPWSAVESVGYIKASGYYTPRLVMKPKEAAALGLGNTLYVPVQMLATGELDLLAALVAYHARYGTTVANTVGGTLKSQI